MKKCIRLVINKNISVYCCI